MRIETEVVEMLKKKYGQGNLRKVIYFYAAGIPEKEWLAEPKQEHKKVINYIVNNVVERKNIAVVGNINIVTHCVTQAMKISLQKKINLKQFEFLSFVDQVQDRYGQLNLDVLKEIDQYDTVAVINIKDSSIFKKADGIFSAVLGSIINSVLQKSVVLAISFNDDMSTEDGEKLFEQKYGELAELISENFSILVV